MAKNRKKWAKREITPARDCASFDSVYAGRILHEVAKGTPIDEAVREVLGTGGRNTFMVWRRLNVEGFADELDDARAFATDVHVDQMLKIAMQAPEGVQGDRLRVNTIQWYAERTNPLKYSPRHMFQTEDEEGNKQTLHAAVAFPPQEPPREGPPEVHPDDEPEPVK